MSYLWPILFVALSVGMVTTTLAETENAPSQILVLSTLGAEPLSFGRVTVWTRSDDVANLLAEVQVKGATPTVHYVLFFVGSKDGARLEIAAGSFATDSSGNGIGQTGLSLAQGHYLGRFEVRRNGVPTFATEAISISLY